MNEEDNKNYELKEAMADAAAGEEDAQIEELKAEIRAAGEVNSTSSGPEPTGADPVESKPEEVVDPIADADPGTDEPSPEPDPEDQEQKPEPDPSPDPEEKPPGPIEGDVDPTVETKNALPLLGNPEDPLFTIAVDTPPDGMNLLAYVHGKTHEHAVRLFGVTFGNVEFRTKGLWDPRLGGEKLQAIPGDAIEQAKNQ